MAEKHVFKVGDYARSLESGWLGKIIAIEHPTELGGLMMKMMGVDWMAHEIAGLTAEESLSADDVQWFGTDDLLPA